LSAAFDVDVGADFDLFGIRFLDSKNHRREAHKSVRSTQEKEQATLIPNVADLLTTSKAADRSVRPTRRCTPTD
jgi:hypothetical protein